MIAPELSEYLSTGCVRHVWTCEACGHNFEDSIDFSAPLEETAAEA
jgi:rubrerythrin